MEQTGVRGRININKHLNRSGTSQGATNVIEQKVWHDLVSTPQLRYDRYLLRQAGA
jgi:hypothetical protein